MSKMPFSSYSNIPNKSFSLIAKYAMLGTDTINCPLFDRYFLNRKSTRSGLFKCSNTSEYTITSKNPSGYGSLRICSTSPTKISLQYYSATVVASLSNSIPTTWQSLFLNSFARYPVAQPTSRIFLFFPTYFMIFRCAQKREKGEVSSLYLLLTLCLGESIITTVFFS